MGIIAIAFWAYFAKRDKVVWGYTGSQVLIIFDGFNTLKSYVAIGISESAARFLYVTCGFSLRPSCAIWQNEGF